MILLQHDNNNNKYEKKFEGHYFQILETLIHPLTGVLPIWVSSKLNNLENKFEDYTFPLRKIV